MESDSLAKTNIFYKRSKRKITAIYHDWIKMLVRSCGGETIHFRNWKKKSWFWEKYVLTVAICGLNYLVIMYFLEYLQGVIYTKKYIQIKMFVFEYEVNSSKIFAVVKIFQCLHLEVFILGRYYYNIFSNCCQFLMAFTNRTRVRYYDV